MISILPVAYHESGHATAAYVLGRPISSLTIWSDGSGEFRGLEIPGRVAATPDDDQRTLRAICEISRGKLDPLRTMDRITQMLCGPLAQERVDADGWWHSSYYDFDTVRVLARTIAPSERVARRWLDYGMFYAHQIVEKHWDAIEALAAQLGRRGRIKRDEIYAVLGQLPNERGTIWHHSHRTELGLIRAKSAQ
jgi:hypothetical protein